MHGPDGQVYSSMETITVARTTTLFTAGALCPSKRDLGLLPCIIRLKESPRKRVTTCGFTYNETNSVASRSMTV